MTVYCPACGESSNEAPVDAPTPGNFAWTCSVCHTVFSIEIGFVTVQEPDDDPA